MDPLAIAASGMRSSELRVAASAHNLANLLTDDFRPLRVTQVSAEQGGSQAYVNQAPHAQEVNIARELIEQMRASHQFNASLRVFATAAEMRGQLVDLLA